MDIQTAVKLYPSFCKLGEDGVLELYCDNHMLSSFRKCQGYFYEQFLSHPGNMLTTRGRSWSLEFGQYLHKCMEYFYQAQRDNWEGAFLMNVPTTTSADGLLSVPQDLISFLQICSDLWKSYDLEYFMAPEFKINIGKNCHNLGGHDGALTLFTQYYKVHWRQERLRFVGWELSFGRDKEVPILDNTPNKGFAEATEFSIKWDFVRSPFRAYYCGRIDLIVDNSEVIGPLDHKTTSYFDGGEGEMFKPHDGMQGYVYSVQQMLGDKVRAEGKMCNSIIINHISIRPAKEIGERFKRSYKSYTPLEMENWLARQRSTFTQLYNMLINDAAPAWNTEACNMWYFSSKCPYKQLHEVPPAAREGLIRDKYELKPAWSPYVIYT